MDFYILEGIKKPNKVLVLLKNYNESVDHIIDRIEYEIPGSIYNTGKESVAIVAQGTENLISLLKILKNFGGIGVSKKFKKNMNRAFGNICHHLGERHIMLLYVIHQIKEIYFYNKLLKETNV